MSETALQRIIRESIDAYMENRKLTAKDGLADCKATIDKLRDEIIEVRREAMSHDQVEKIVKLELASAMEHVPVLVEQAIVAMAATPKANPDEEEAKDKAGTGEELKTRHYGPAARAKKRAERATAVIRGRGVKGPRGPRKRCPKCDGQLHVVNKTAASRGKPKVYECRKHGKVTPKGA